MLDAAASAAVVVAAAVSETDSVVLSTLVSVAVALSVLVSVATDETAAKLAGGGEEPRWMMRRVGHPCSYHWCCHVGELGHQSCSHGNSSCYREVQGRGKQ